MLREDELLSKTFRGLAWNIRNCVTLRRLKADSPELRRKAVQSLARSKNVASYWAPKSQEEQILFYVEQETWMALEQLAREEGPGLADSDVSRRELLRSSVVSSRLVHICPLTACESGAELILSARVAGRID